ncbi:phage tail family protein [Alkalihalophilus marmarensis]|jgi:predicted phage tail component-like protein|uniref:distal tail protein Dit n=1 Tax=Alkalihalophilus marmarensis TaxID=521377 RepID=UPI0020404CB1|nr:distal tail protein Dit [Alkalihalophilus marmarensis]MCM3487900.1 phage tail family protein [Alkalihalophilus marmarensis]
MAHFNGINLKEWFSIEKVTRPLAPPIEHKTVTVPGRDGSYDNGVRLGERMISLDVWITAKSKDERQQKIRAVMGVLFTREPKPLFFDDEPDVFYNAKLSGSTDVDELLRFGKTTLTFVCSDPFKYDTQETKVNLNDGSTTVHYDGTYETKPRFKITFNQPVTHFEIKNHLNERILLGRPAAMTDTEIQREELVFQDNMGSVSSWVVPDYVDNGHIAGEMASDGSKFYAERYGHVVQPEAWQGPSLKRSIGVSLQDFRMDALVTLNNVGFETGMVEIYLLDANNQTVAKIGVEDIWKQVARVQGKFQLGRLNNRHQMYAHPVYSAGWNNYRGMLRIERVGNVYRPYWAKIEPDGRHVWQLSTMRYVDHNNQYDSRITQVQVGIRVWPLHKPLDQSVDQIKVFRINQPQTTTQIPYIAQAGDVIEIDTATHSIRKNGEVFLINDLSSEFFSLLRGENVLNITPGVAQVEMIYERRWL